MKCNKICLDIFFDKEWFMEQYDNEYNKVEDTPQDEEQDNMVETETSTIETPESEDGDESSINDVDESVQNEDVKVDINELEVDGVSYDIEKIKSLQETNSNYEKQINELNSNHQKEVDQLSSQLNLANQAMEFYNYLKSNPHIVESMKSFDNPEVARQFQEKFPKEPPLVETKFQELEEKVRELELRNTVYELKGKYEDFNEDEVLKYAVDNSLYNLEVAYKALKTENLSHQPKEEPNLDEIRKQIREEILNEMKDENSNVKTLVTSKPSQAPKVKEFNLTAEQKRMAIEFGMTEEEYATML